MSDQLPRAAGAVAAVLAAGLLAAGQSPAGAGTPAVAAPLPAHRAGTTAPSTAQPTAQTHTVTLLTGDVVTLTDTGDGPGTARVDRRPGAPAACRSRRSATTSTSYRTPPCPTSPPDASTPTCST